MTGHDGGGSDAEATARQEVEHTVGSSAGAKEKVCAEEAQRTAHELLVMAG